MSAGGPRVAPAPVPADVGIVAALPIEVSSLKGRLNDLRKYAVGRYQIIEGECAGRLVALITPGPGRAAARRGTELLLAGHRPRWVLSTGFAGALDPALQRFEILVATTVIDPDGQRWHIDARVPETGPFRSGALVTVDRIIRTAAEKAELHRNHGALAVDMESSAVVEVCVGRGVRFLGVRIISDVATEDLPPEILSLLGPSGGFRLGAAVGALWRRPSCLTDLWTLREHAYTAAERLAAALPTILKTLG